MSDLKKSILRVVNSIDCLNCRGCCWFSMGEEHLLPFFGPKEFELLDVNDQKKLHETSEGFFQAKSISSTRKRTVKICAFLEEDSHKCSIYDKRPLDCVLWPFDVVRLEKGKKAAYIYRLLTTKCALL